MDWMKTYHEDHKSVLVLLAKFTGNILDLKAGLSTPYTFVEFKEFADVINNVIIPHFKKEETTIYAEIRKKSPAGSDFIDEMLRNTKNSILSLMHTHTLWRYRIRKKSSQSVPGLTMFSDIT